MPNSEVKRCEADGSVGIPHVRVGHRQTFILSPYHSIRAFLLLFSYFNYLIIFFDCNN